MKVLPLPWRTLFVCIFILATAAVLAGQELPGSIRGFKKETLEVYFNRADQERESSAWERVAGFGAEAAVSLWEREASDLYTDPDQIAQARTQLSGWVGAQMQERYQAWLTRRFFDRQGSLGSEAVLRAITGANLQYLYTIDAQGKIILDESGDPVLRGAIGVENDRKAWNEHVATATEEVLAAWELKVDAAFAPELGGLLSPDDLAKYNEYKGSLEAGLRREIEKVALQGELSMAARRLYDQYSLRKKSESATADAIADQIVKETRQQTDQGIEQIRSSLALNPDSVDSSIPSIDAQQWLSSFKAVFEKGLSRWDAAEEKLLTSRMEWERDAGLAYKEGETAWAAAFDRLGTERKAWEQQIETLIYSGMTKWDGEQNELAKAIDDARTELQKECSERLASMEDRVAALVDVYAQSVQVISTAIASGQEVIQKLDIRDVNGNYVKFSKDAVPDLIAWRKDTWTGYVSKLNTEISDLSAAAAASRSRIDEYQDQYVAAVISFVFAHLPDAVKAMDSAQAEKAAEEQNLQGINARISAAVLLQNQMSPVDFTGAIQGDTSLAHALDMYENHLRSTGNLTQAEAVQLAWERMSRMDDWLAMLDTYTLSAGNAKAELEKTLGSALGSQVADLRDVLKTDGDSGIAYLDEYQLELLRAKAIEDYWRQQEVIADAVVAYAQNVSSTRDTADQGQKEYDAAKKRYDARLAEYNSALAELQQGGVGLAAARQAIEAAHEAMVQDSAAYEEARQKYLDALVSSQTGNVDFYRGQIGQKYKELLDASGMSGSDSQLMEATVAYFAAARKHGYDLAIDSAWQSVAALVKGDPETGLVPLSVLKDAAHAIRIPLSPASIPSSIEELGVPINEQDYPIVSALFAAWRDSASVEARTLAGAKLINYLGLLAARQQAAYQERLAEVRAYGAIDAEAWYTGSGGKTGTGTLEERLSADDTAAALALISSRARVEKRGLEAWVALEDGHDVSDQYAVTLAKSAPAGLDKNEAFQRMSELDELITGLDGAAGDNAAAVARLRDRTSAGGWIQAFVGGQGTFVDARAGDLVLGFCLPEYGETERAGRLLAVWGRASECSTALVAQKETEALDAIRKVFTDQGLQVPDSGVLPSAEVAAARVSSSSGDAVGAARFVAELGEALRTTAANGPRWLEDRVSDYYDALCQYAAADAVRKGAAVGTAARVAQAETAAEQAAASKAELDSLAQGLQGSGRFESFVELYNRSAGSSAEVAGARDVIVSAGAAEAAKRYLAEPTATLRTIAVALAPRMTAALADAIEARARELLATQNGASAEGQRIAAYRTWNCLGVAQAVSGISVNPAAAEARILWEEVASRNLSALDLEAALDMYRSKFSAENPEPVEITVLCEGIADGYEDVGSLFRRVLFGDDFDARLASIRSLGPSGAVYERAMALTLAAGSQAADDPERRSLAVFLCARAGLGFADDAAEFAGLSFDLEAAAFAGAGALAAEYRAKLLISRGQRVTDSLMACLSLSPDNLAEVNAFSEMMRKTGGYLAALDGSAETYAEKVEGSDGPDLPARSNLTAAISGGQWDDTLFASSSTDNFLDWYKAVADSALCAAASTMTVLIADESSALSQECGADRLEAGWWRRVQDLADTPSSWRDYLSDANLGEGASAKAAPTSETKDTDGYARSAAGTKDNAVLEAYNNLTQAGAALNAQLAADNTDDGAIARFHDFLDAFASGSAPESDLPAAGVPSLALYEESYKSALARIEGLKEDISRSGQALSFLDLDTEHRTMQIAALKASMEALDAKKKTEQSAVDKAVAGFEQSGQDYNALMTEVQDSSDLLEVARLDLRVREEIQDWAASGYLAASGETTADYQSPADRQRQAADELVRATAAKDALVDLFGEEPLTDRPIEDAATLAAYNMWKAKYSALMRMQRITGDLAAATDAQAKKVEDLEQALQAARREFLDRDTALSSIKAGQWGSYLIVRDGKLELNISDTFVLTSLGTQDVQGVKDYFTLPDGSGHASFDLQAESWTGTVQKLAAQFGGMDALIDRWGFAADWLRRRLYDANGSIGSLLSNYASDDNFAGSAKWVNLNIAGKDFDRDVRSYINEAVAYDGAMYSSVIANSEEKSAFAFYFAMTMAGGKYSDSSSQFESRTSEMIFRKIAAIADNWYEHCRQKAIKQGKLRHLLGGAADRDAAQVIKDEARNKLESLQNTRDSGKIEVSIDAWQNYQAGMARLAELQGASGETLDSFDAFIAQYRKVAAERQGTTADKVDVPADLLAQFGSGWAQLTPEDKSSFSRALQRMTLLASLDAAAAEKEVQNDLAGITSQAARAQQEYQDAYKAFLAGTVTMGEFQDAARRAFKNAGWVAKAEDELSCSVLDEAAFSGGANLNAVEAQARISALHRYAQSIMTTYANALDARAEKANQAWDQSAQDLADRCKGWKAQATLIRAKAESAWARGQEKLGSALVQWRQGFQQEYAEKSEAWRQAYLGLGESKLEWVQATQEKAAQAGNEAILSEVGASADDSSRKAGTMLIGGMSYDPNEATVRVEALLGDVGGGASLSALRQVNAGIGQSEAAIARVGVRVDISGASIAAEARRFVAQSRSELAEMAARELADNARQSVADAKQALSESVKQANEGFETSMDNCFTEAGYAKGSVGYARETILRSTVFSTVSENLRVTRYVWYAMPVLQLKVDLSQSRLVGLGAGAVIDLVGAAQGEVGEAQKRIFGEGKELSDQQKTSKGLLAVYQANGKSVTKEVGEGEFGAHIGYAPEFSDEPDFDKSESRNIVVSGKGELGRLMGDFIWNEMKEGRGWSEMALPRWDKPLWDDSGSWFKAPSIRSVGTIVAGIVAAVVVPGGGAMTLGTILGGAAISTSSTVLFDSLDVAYGYKSWQEAGLDVGKSFLTSTVTSTIGGVFNGFNPMKEGASGFWDTGLSGVLGTGKSVVGKALLAGAQTFTTNTASSAISAINWTDGKLGWDKDTFLAGSFGTGAWASVAGAAGAAGVTTALGNWNLYDGNNVDLSNQVFNRKSIESFNSLAGGLTSTGIQYGITGEATLNVMNFADFGSTANYGLMEMHLGGSRGFGMNFGSNGTNVSLGAIGASMSGVNDTLKITDAKVSAALGDQRGISTLNAVNMMGYTKVEGNYSIAQAIWAGQKNVNYYDASTAGITEQDLKALGYAEGTSSIGVNAKLLGGGMEGAAQVASLFTHEGIHLGGKGEFEAKIAGTSAYSDLMTAFGVTGKGYEETGLAWSAGMLQKYGAGGFGFIASAQIASEGKTVGERQYEHAAEMDLLKLAAVQNDRAIGSINNESDKLWSYLVNGEGSFALLAGNEKFNKFTSGVLSSENYGDAFALLNGLREALKDSKDSVANSIYSHDMLQYTTNAFRGSDGFDGLSGALFLANLASGEGSARYDNPSGYLINDVALTYTGEYLNINYDRSGSEAGKTPGASYWANSNTVERGYGKVVTGWFSDETNPKWSWQDTNGSVPSLDCVGYVDLVAYAAGALGDGQSYRGMINKRTLDSSSKDYSNALAARLKGETGSMQNALLADFDYGLPESWAERVAAKQASGVYLTSYDTRIDPVAAPQVGDLVFLGPPGDMHIGFYGIDDQGQNLLIHSAPRKEFDDAVYEAGPRTNTLIDWNDEGANDSYSNWLVDKGYFTGWRDQFNGGGANFGRIKPWWDASLLGGR